VEDADDENGAGLDAVKDQVAAKHAAANAAVFVARDQREGFGIVRELRGALPKRTNEIPRPQGTALWI
jgi:hypothetical protein